MAARALKDLDNAVPPVTRALTLEIRTAHQNAGSPSFTHLDGRNVRAGRGTLAKSTLSRILTPDPAAKDQSLPAWSYYEGLLYALDVDPAPFQARWQAAQEEWQARARGESAELAEVLQAGRQPVSVGPGLPTAATSATSATTVVELGPRTELSPRPDSAFGPQTAVRTVRVRRRYSLPVSALIVGAMVAVAIGAFVLIGSSRSGAQSTTPASNATHQPTAVLVTNSPPKTVAGRIVRTWNQDADNGHGGSIGVLVFPTPFALNGSNGPRHDGDLLEVVCHTEHGRLTHERLDTAHENSTGWFQIYYEDRLWWVADHYISFAAGVQVPACGR
jgi:hypothetical protein